MQCKDRPDFRCWLFNEEEEDPIRLFESLQSPAYSSSGHKTKDKTSSCKNRCKKKKFNALDLNWMIGGRVA